MIHWSRIAVVVSLLGGSALVACTGPDWGYSEGFSVPGGGAEESTDTPTDAGIIKGDGAPSAMPMLVKIDPNASMVQTPGQGVGVFTQYDAGGHWYVWWTCDTITSGQACDFDIQITAAHGLITGATSQNFLETDLLTLGASSDGGSADGGSADGGDNDAGVSASITSQTTTTTDVQGVHFETEPGDVITLSAALGGEYSGAFLFFVEDTRVNGGYTGTVSDPLELQSSSP